ncbi:MAG: VWA domain-containing protein [Verrucomicrobiota bacterium]
MTFLQPGFLIPFAAAIAIPALIHWLSRRFPKKFLFSSVDELKRTMIGRSRLLKWRHLLLILLRTLAIAALLTAFLRPVTGIDADESEKKGRRVILIVDHSLSMTAAESGATARNRAIGEVRRLLETLAPDARFQLILAGRSPRAAFPDFTNHRNAALDFLDKASPPANSADIHAAVALAASIGEPQSEAPDVYFFSDFQRKNWADASFKRLREGTKLVFVPTTDDPQRANRAILRLEPGPAAPVAGAPFEIKLRIANYSQDAWKGKVEARFLDGPTTEKEVSLPAWGESDVSMSLVVPAAGLHPLIVTLPDDSLPLDNARHLIIEAGDQEEVVVLTPDIADPAAPEPALFIATAVNPYGPGEGAYRPRLLDPAALDPAALGGATRIVTSRLPLIGNEAAGTLAGFIRSGGGVVWFLDSPDSAENLSRLSQSLGIESPLRLTEAYTSEQMPDGRLQLARGDFSSRFLKLFEGERRQNLGRLEFYSVYRAAHQSEGRSLLSFADGTPAMIEVQAGLGTVLLCNFSIAEDASNLARQRLFPAWIHEFLRRLDTSSSEASDRFLPGDPLHAEGWTSEVAGRELIGPDGKPINYQTSLRGERVSVSFTPELTGFHRLKGSIGTDVLAFAVNPDTQESDLRSLDPKVLPQRASGQGVDKATAMNPLGDFAEILNGRPAFHWFVLLALLFLVFESFVIRSSAPKAA